YLTWWCRPGGRYSLHNSLALTTGGMVFSDLSGNLKDVSLDISNNTLVSARSVHHYVNGSTKGRVDEPKSALFTMRVACNVFNPYGDTAFGFSIDNEQRPHTAAELQESYRRSLSWREQGNLYAEGKGLFIIGSKSVPVNITVKDLAQWQAFWGWKET